MRFVLRADQGGVTIKIPYNGASAYAVFANGREKEYTKWDVKEGRHGAISGRQGCGENRFVGVENFLEFYIT